MPTNILLNHTNMHNQAAIREIRNTKYPSIRQFTKYSSCTNYSIYSITLVDLHITHLDLHVVAIGTHQWPIICKLPTQTKTVKSSQLCPTTSICTPPCQVHWTGQVVVKDERQNHSYVTHRCRQTRAFTCTHLMRRPGHRHMYTVSFQEPPNQNPYIPTDFKDIYGFPLVGNYIIYGGTQAGTSRYKCKQCRSTKSLISTRSWVPRSHYTYHAVSY